MIRAVLVGRAEGDWRLYRQPQWMAEVRRSPDATRLPRKHYDIDEPAFATIVETWEREGAGARPDGGRRLPQSVRSGRGRGPLTP